LAARGIIVSHETVRQWARKFGPFNVTGQPGLVIPAGFAKNGLPLSLQLVGHPFAEAMLYRVAQCYGRDWLDEAPPSRAN
jgi:Asp-tRNA(Asn)/Glu-tRNA(Gln) amidotransferase A subunit family amidase